MRESKALGVVVFLSQGDKVALGALEILADVAVLDKVAVNDSRQREAVGFV